MKKHMVRGIKRQNMSQFQESTENRKNASGTWGVELPDMGFKMTMMTILKEL